MSKLAVMFTILLITSGTVVPTSTTASSSRKICLFFDDGWENHYSVVLPILQEFGFKATFGIIVNYIGLNRSTFFSRMNYTELSFLKQAGMEIACHTMTHPHLLNLSKEALDEEIKKAKQVLEAHGFQIKTFIYPYGEFNDTIQRYVAEAGYWCARTIESGVFFPSEENRYSLPGWVADTKTMDDFVSFVESIPPGGVGCIVYHFISDEGPAETTVPIKLFRKQLEYLKENNFEIVIASSLFSAPPAPPPTIPWSILILVGAYLFYGAALFLIFRRRTRKKKKTITGAFPVSSSLTSSRYFS